MEHEVKKISYLTSKLSISDPRKMPFLEKVAKTLTNVDARGNPTEHDWSAEHIEGMFNRIVPWFGRGNEIDSKVMEGFDKIFDNLKDPEQKTAFRRCIVESDAHNMLAPSMPLEQKLDTLIEFGKSKLTPEQAEALLRESRSWDIVDELRKSQNPGKFADIFAKEFKMENLSKYRYSLAGTNRMEKTHDIANSEHKLEDLDKAFAHVCQATRGKVEKYPELFGQVTALSHQRLLEFNDFMKSISNLDLKAIKNTLKSLKKK